MNLFTEFSDQILMCSLRPHECSQPWQAEPWPVGLPSKPLLLLFYCWGKNKWQEGEITPPSYVVWKGQSQGFKIKACSLLLIMFHDGHQGKEKMHPRQWGWASLATVKTEGASEAIGCWNGLVAPTSCREPTCCVYSDMFRDADS